MKIKLTFVLAAFIVFATCISSCKKSGDSSGREAVQADLSFNGKTISVVKGQSLVLTLGNPSDGGYAFDSPQYNTAVLSLTNHTYIAPTSGAIGNSGKDTWEFKSIKGGNSTLSITATRSFDKAHPVIMFSGTVAVN